MANVAIPHTFVDGATLVAAQFNLNFSTIYNEFDGNIDNQNIKVNAAIDGSKIANTSIPGAKLVNDSVGDDQINYAAPSGVKVVQSGPNISGNGVRLARGNKAYTLAGGTQAITITFATESADGNPGFTSTPQITIGNVHASTVNQITVIITASSLGSFSLEIKSNSGVDNTSGSIDWHAVGPI